MMEGRSSGPEAGIPQPWSQKRREPRLCPWWLPGQREETDRDIPSPHRGSLSLEDLCQGTEIQSAASTGPKGWAKL